MVSPGKGKHADARVTVAINDLLRQHCKPLGDGIAEYTGDWDDERIAASAGGTKSAVARIRQQLHGRLFNRNVGGNERITELEDHLRTLIHQHADLQHRFSTLCETLALNRVAQVRHLGRAANNGSAHASATAPPQPSSHHA